ncbi:MAG: GntR family transcriptional repressor for pyruvate dehydrogenase complex [Desulforhopalus sp.]
MPSSSGGELSPKKRISDTIKRDLKQAILDGVYKPGDKLSPEIEIARQYGVSKVSAREALRELEIEGLIVKKRGIFGGSFVAEPGAEKMVDVVTNAYLFGGVTVTDLAEFRQILEPGLARLAAKRRTDNDLAAMEDCIAGIHLSIEEGDPDQTKAIGFHKLIADACHNRFVSGLMGALVFVFQQVLDKEPDLETARMDVRYNELFFEHIKARDGEKAELIMKEHFNVLEEIIRQRRKNGETIS